MLGNVTPSLVDKLLERYYDGDASKVPVVDYLAPAAVAPSYFVESAKEKNNNIFNISKDVPKPSVWSEDLARPHLNWLRVILTSPTIVRGTSYVDNPLKRLLVPRPGQKAVVLIDGSAPIGLEIYGAT